MIGLEGDYQARQSRSLRRAAQLVHDTLGVMSMKALGSIIVMLPAGELVLIVPGMTVNYILRRSDLIPRARVGVGPWIWLAMYLSGQLIGMKVMIFR